MSHVYTSAPNNNNTLLMSHVYTSAPSNNKGSTITWNGLGLDSGLE